MRRLMGILVCGLICLLLLGGNPALRVHAQQQHLRAAPAKALESPPRLLGSGQVSLITPARATRLALLPLDSEERETSASTLLPDVVHVRVHPGRGPPSRLG